jgi:hypothetical protein
LTSLRSPACSNHAVLEPMRSRQTAGHQTGLASFRRSLPAKPCVQPSSEGACHPPSNQRKPGQEQARYDEEPDHPFRQRHLTTPEAQNVGSTEVGPPLLADQQVRKRGNWEGVFRLHIAPWGEPAPSPKRGSW